MIGAGRWTAGKPLSSKAVERNNSNAFDPKSERDVTCEGGDGCPEDRTGASCPVPQHEENIHRVPL